MESTWHSGGRGRTHAERARFSQLFVRSTAIPNTQFDFAPDLTSLTHAKSRSCDCLVLVLTVCRSRSARYQPPAQISSVSPIAHAHYDSFVTLNVPATNDLTDLCTPSINFLDSTHHTLSSSHGYEQDNMKANQLSESRHYFCQSYAKSPCQVSVSTRAVRVCQAWCCQR